MCENLTFSVPDNPPQKWMLFSHKREIMNRDEVSKNKEKKCREHLQV